MTSWRTLREVRLAGMLADFATGADITPTQAGDRCDNCGRDLARGEIKNCGVCRGWRHAG